MDNEEIRHRILLSLYKKYYLGAFYDPLITEEVISQLDIPTELTNVIHMNLVYLEEAGFIYGVYSSPYPNWIRIESAGIDVVESNEHELGNLHWDIRFRILSVLYERYFSDVGDKTILVDPDLIKRFSLPETDRNLILGDLIYFHSKHQIWGYPRFGSPYRFRVRIDNSGIEAVEYMMKAMLNQIGTQVNSDKVYEITTQLNKKIKFEKFRELLGENSRLIELGVNILKSFFMGG